MFRRRRFPRPLLYLLLIFLLFWGLSSTGILRALRGWIEKTAVVPVREEVFAWRRFFKKDLSGCELKNERETAELKVKIASLIEENQEQKRLLSSPLPKNWQFLPVKVIGLTGEELTIGAGKSDGVAAGMAALWGETYLGKVTEVSERIAKIRLPSFFEERLVVSIVSAAEKNQLGQGLLVGWGEGRMKVEQILAAEKVEKGDLVMTNVEGGDLLVGEVEEAVYPKGEAFKSASVRRLYNPEELKTIFLIRGKL